MLYIEAGKKDREFSRHYPINIRTLLLQPAKILTEIPN